jgi:uncharacterized membrane protein YfcA
MDDSIINFIIVGFLAQTIDGALGMAYGVSSTSFLLGIGVPPAAASASVHMAEVFTSGVSGFSHLKLANVNKRVLKKLLIPGVIGGVLGAYLLTAIPGDAIRPFIAVYLLIMGLVILRKATKKTGPTEAKVRLVPLGFIAGFLDAVGGGGWGPIATATLVGKGHNPRYAIGSVNLAEFFVTLAQAATFFALLGMINWRIFLGLLIGGVLAAPLAAYVCQRLPARALMIMVGILITALSLRTIYQTL